MIIAKVALYIAKMALYKDCIYNQYELSC